MYRLSRFNRNSKVKSNINLFNSHEGETCLGSIDSDLYICAIDPGIRNLCLRISKYNRATEKSTSIVFDKIDLIEAKDEGRSIDYYGRMFNHLDKYKHLLINCQYIGVEAQLPINYDMVRMGQHIITYLMCLVRNLGCKPLIFEIDPKLKSKMLLAPKMNKAELKIWSRDMAVMFLRNDGEVKAADILEKLPKGDDYGDVICYEKVIILLLENKLIPEPKPNLEHIS